MHFTSELQKPRTFSFVSENIKIERGDYLGTKNYSGLLNYFVFAFSVPPFSVGETLHLAYKILK